MIIMQWKKPGKRQYILYDSIYIKFSMQINLMSNGIMSNGQLMGRAKRGGRASL